MRFAYHWNDDGSGWLATEGEWFQAALAETRPLRHLLLHKGNLLLHDYLPTDTEARSAFLAILHGGNAGLWSSLPLPEYLQAVQAHRIFVLVASGLSRREGVAVHRALVGSDQYLGAAEIDVRLRPQYVLYRSLLYTSYRLVANQLRLLHTTDAIAPEDNRDYGSLRHWQSTRLFSEVVWENRGPRGTIFDDFDSYQVTVRMADTLERASERVESVVDEVIMRCFDLDPRLIESLNAALKRLHDAGTSEELAQGALSVRRFLERLANALFPPQRALRKGRKVGKAEFKNRLWAYVDAALDETAADSISRILNDLGSRIDDTLAAAQSGVHAPVVQRLDVDRLIVGVLTLTHDLLAIRQPPLCLPDEPYNEGVSRIIRQMLFRDQSSEDRNSET